MPTMKWCWQWCDAGNMMWCGQLHHTCLSTCPNIPQVAYILTFSHSSHACHHNAIILPMQKGPITYGLVDKQRHTSVLFTTCCSIQVGWIIQYEYNMFGSLLSHDILMCYAYLMCPFMTSFMKSYYLLLKCRVVVWSVACLFHTFHYYC